MRMLKSGKVLLGRHTLPCAIRNVSEGGACLEISSTYGIPKTFDLVIGEKPARTCKVMWLNDARVGVEFQDVAHPDHPVAA
jgi:PilZ domain-containing protein